MEMLSVTVPGEKLPRCIFLVTGGISERTPEDSASLHLSCGVEWIKAGIKAGEIVDDKQGGGSHIKCSLGPYVFMKSHSRGQQWAHSTAV